MALSQLPRALASLPSRTVLPLAALACFIVGVSVSLPLFCLALRGAESAAASVLRVPLDAAIAAPVGGARLMLHAEIVAFDHAADVMRVVFVPTEVVEDGGGHREQSAFADALVARRGDRLVLNIGGEATSYTRGDVLRQSTADFSLDAVCFCRLRV